MKNSGTYLGFAFWLALSLVNSYIAVTTSHTPTLIFSMPAAMGGFAILTVYANRILDILKIEITKLEEEIKQSKP